MNRKKWLLLSVLMGILALGIFDRYNVLADFDDETLPVDWYQLPEDQSVSQETEGLRLGRQPKTPVSNLFRSIGTSLDNYSELSAPNANKWHFDRLVTKFAVSARGFIGLLLGGGSFSTEIDWRQKSAPSLVDDKKLSESREGQITLSTNFNEDEVLTQIEPVMQALVATGKIENVPLFRSNYKEQVLAHHRLFQGFRAVGSQQWRPRHFYLFLRFSAAGNVHTNVTVGGGIVSLLTWSIDNRNNDLPHENEDRYQKQLALQKFTNDLGFFLDGTDEVQLLAQKFTLKSVGFSVGLTGSGLIGMVFASGGVSAGISFSKRPARLDHIQPPRSLDSFYLIESAPKSHHVEYARSNNIEHRWDGENTMIYKIPFEKFRKGMEKALDISSFFAKKSRQVTLKKWYVSEIESLFSLSISGFTSIVNLGVTASVKVNIIGTEQGHSL